MTKNTFHARFAEALSELNISNAQFARECRMSRANVTHWLNGKRAGVPSAELAERAAHRLGVRLGWLLRGEGAKRSEGARPPDPPRGLYVVHSPEEIGNMEYTRASLDVARAFMKLPEDEREKFKRQIELAALKHSAPKVGQPFTRRMSQNRTVETVGTSSTTTKRKPQHDRES